MRITTETIVGLFMTSALVVFLFMSFKIGVWRFDTVRYAHYIAYFSDVSGLNSKADVVIAGVKVGWVEKLSLVPRSGQVRIDMMIERSSTIHTDAYAIIRQNGLLGTKYVEIIPGDSILPVLPTGSTLMKPSKPPVSIDELMGTFKQIADNVNTVSASLKEVVSGKENTQSMKSVIVNAHEAFETIEKTAGSLNSIFKENTDRINTIVNSLQHITHTMNEQVPQTMKSIKQTADSLSNSVDRISKSFDKAVHPLSEAMNKIDSGKGVLGALVNDDKLLKEVKTSVNGIKDYFEYMGQLGVTFDMRFEGMQGRGNDLEFRDGKGYMNVYLQPNEDFYYLLGVTSSFAGTIKRYRTDTQWYNQEKHQIVPEYLNLEDWQKLWFAPVKEEYVRDYNALLWNIQFAKTLGRVVLRTGLFESSFGIAIDYDIPLHSDVKWLSTLEAFRFTEFLSETTKGRVDFNVDRPHLKWLNRVFFNDSIYVAFGADDFISRYNKNFFAGFGLTFENNEVKYLAGTLKMPS